MLKIRKTRRGRFTRRVKNTQTHCLSFGKKKESLFGLFFCRLKRVGLTWKLLIAGGLLFYVFTGQSFFDLATKWMHAENESLERINFYVKNVELDSVSLDPSVGFHFEENVTDVPDLGPQGEGYEFDTTNSAFYSGGEFSMVLSGFEYLVEEEEKIGESQKSKGESENIDEEDIGYQILDIKDSEATTSEEFDFSSSSEEILDIASSSDEFEHDEEMASSVEEILKEIDEKYLMDDKEDIEQTEFGTSSDDEIEKLGNWEIVDIESEEEDETVEIVEEETEEQEVEIIIEEENEEKVEEISSKEEAAEVSEILIDEVNAEEREAEEVDELSLNLFGPVNTANAEEYISDEIDEMSEFGEFISAKLNFSLTVRRKTESPEKKAETINQEELEEEIEETGLIGGLIEKITGADDPKVMEINDVEDDGVVVEVNEEEIEKLEIDEEENVESGENIESINEQDRPVPPPAKGGGQEGVLTNEEDVEESNTVTEESDEISFLDWFANEAKAQNGTPKINIWYSFDTATSEEAMLWQQLDTIDFKEIDNFRNNGYFSFDFAALDSWDKIENLQIKLEGVLADGENWLLYIDSAWISVDYRQETELEKIKKRERWEEALRLLSERNDFGFNEKGEMRFEYKKNENVIWDTLYELIGRDNFWEDIDIDIWLENQEGERIDYPLSIIFEEDGEFTVKFDAPDREFVPGKYYLKFLIKDYSGDTPEIFELEQDFSWGVVAFNFNRSVYEVGSIAYLQMAVLDDKGRTLCDADLELNITSPEGQRQTVSTAGGGIRKDPLCGPKTISNEPDYYTHYQLNELGEYRFDLTVNTANGEKKLTEFVSVEENLNILLERRGPTRIYPLADYSMNLHITSKEGFVGTIEDIVPAGFKVFSESINIKKASTTEFVSLNPGLPVEKRVRFSVEDGEAGRILEWSEVSLEAGDELLITYSFDAPDVSPEFYLLGELEIINENDVTSPDTVFAEKRKWQIASDETPSDLSADNQYRSDGQTAIVNGDFAGATNNTVMLSASASLYSSNTLSYYFEVKEESDNFTSATSVPASPCDSGTAYGSCSSQIWVKATTTEGWYGAAWEYRKLIKIESDYVSTTTDAFPVYIDVTDSDLLSEARSDGYDILFTADDGVTKLDYERENYNSSTGNLIGWVETAVDENVDTYLYMYYGNSSASDQANPTGVWDADTSIVYHMNEDPGPGNAGDILDSTANSNDATAQTSMTAGDLISSCKLYQCYDFDGADDYIQSATGPFDPSTTPFYASAWVYADTFDNLDASLFSTEDAVVLDQYTTQTRRSWLAVRETTWPNADTVYTTRIGNTDTQSGNPDTGVWRHWAVRYDGTTVYLYINGTFVDSNAVTPESTSGYMRIGADHAPDDLSEEWDGRIDEVHIHSTDRGLGWIQTEYENQDDPDQFMDYYSEEAYAEYSEMVSVNSIPDSSEGYKWQVLACDENGDCFADWEGFNASTPNFHVDVTSPTAPGALSQYERDSSSVTLSFGATTTEINFLEYIIYYKLYDGTNADSGDSVFASTSDENLGYIDYNSAATTTIGGLTAGQTYSFNIYAYDKNGHSSASPRLDVEMNTLPTGVFNTAQQRSNGSGIVDISIDVGDGNSNPAKAKLEYVLGEDCDFSSPNDPTLDSNQTNIQADFGTPKIDNNEEYQIGSSSGWIITSAGLNTVQFDWFGKTDLSTADDTYCLRLTANDNKEDQLNPATTTITIDNIAPNPTGDLSFGEVTDDSVKLIFAAGNPAADTNEPVTNAYKIFYKQGTSGVTEGGTEHDSTALNAYDYNGISSTTVSGLDSNTWYVFNIWSYDAFGNKASSTEIAVKTEADVQNVSLAFIDPETDNVAIGDSVSVYDFEAVVTELNGYSALESVTLRLENDYDETAPFDDIAFYWDQASDEFSEIGTDLNDSVTLLQTSTSSCAGTTCTLNFHVVFSHVFASSSVDYTAALETENELGIIDIDNYADFYEVQILKVSQIHYRWRNNDGGE